MSNEVLSTSNEGESEPTAADKFDFDAWIGNSEIP